MDEGVGGLTGFLMLGIVGLIIGGVAKLLMPGKDPGGWFVTILLGIAGSWAGGFVGGLLGGSGRVGFIGSVLGAMLLLFVYRRVKPV